jgi:iron(III) transport system substrate-binding protein
MGVEVEGSMHHRIPKRRAFLAAVLALGVVLASASAGTSAPTKAPPPSPIKALVKSLKGMSLSAREARLQKLAAQEGQVNVYTSLSSLVVKPLQAAWAKRYPDVKLSLYRASSEDVTARVLAERNAGTSGADIVETNGTNMLIFQHMKNVLVPYKQAPARRQIAKAYGFDTFSADRIEKFVVAWNTNLVSNPPRTFQDLTNPRWKGKLAIEPTDVDWFAALYTYFTKQRKPRMSTAAADRMFKAIAANAQLIEGHTNEANLLAAGQVQVIVSGHAQSIEQLQAKHAPIAFSPFVTPVVERPQGVGVSYRLPHKAAALLFYDWLLSPEGQKIMLDNGVEPARKGFNDSAFSSNPKTVKVDERPIVANYVKWSKKFDSITRAAGG